MKKMIVVGDSQVFSFSLALKDEAFRAELSRPFETRFIANGNIIKSVTLTLEGGEVILNPVITAQFGASIKDAKTFWNDHQVALLIGGAEHNRHALMSGGEEFDFLMQPDGAVAGGRPFVPSAMVSSFFESVFESFGRGVKLISQLSVGQPFYVLQGPPPAVEDEAMEKYLAANFAKSPRKVAKLDFRLRMHAAASDALERIVVREGGVFVRSPKQAETPEGALKPVMTADPFHANSTYGKLFLKEFDHLLSKAAAKPAA